MRILQVNKFHYPRGGADKYYLALGRALAEQGEEVAYFSMAHPANEESPWSRYFVSRLSFNEGSFFDKLRAPGRVLYSLEAKRKFRRLLADFRPQIVHIHNIYHQLSPSILGTAKKAGLPVVMHVHDYKLICPNYKLFVNGRPCEACRGGRYQECCRRRCLNGSWSRSLLATIEMYLHHRFLKIYEKNIDLLIAPSAFMKEKLVEFGWPSEKIFVVLNPHDSSLPALPKPADIPGYLLYFGRLSAEKGGPLLIKAAAAAGESLKIAGRGPEEANWRALAEKAGGDVEFLGSLSGTDLAAALSGAKVVIIPSIWYENMPLSALEALAAGKPVIASRIGGLPEIVIDGENGLLFTAGSIEDLERQIKKFNSLNQEALSKAALASSQRFSPEKNLAAVIQIYRRLLS